MISNPSTESVREFFAGNRAWFELSLKSKKNSIAICRENSQRVDILIRKLFERTSPDLKNRGRLAVVALGGLGREEQGLFSDIDLMFLHEGMAPFGLQKLTDGILYPLWNNSIEASGAARTIGENFEIAGKDMRVLTTLLETRFISGDETIYSELCKMTAEYFSNPASLRKFIGKKIEERDEKLSRFGDPIYLLEPNVKEGRGGLRDLHLLNWIIRARHYGEDPANLLKREILDPVTRGEMERAFEFIWAVRHALHLALGKRADRLSSSLQPAVAAALGFTGDENPGPVDEMMSAYHRHATSLRLISARAIERVRRSANPTGRMKKIFACRRIGKKFIRTEYGTLLALKPEDLNSPNSIIECFSVAKRVSLAIDIETKEAMTSFVRGFDASAMLGPDVQTQGHLRDIFSDPKYLSRTLLEMNECGVLSMCFPEMASLFHRVQHDGLHSYTVGIHSINIVAEIGSLLKKGEGRTFPVEREALSSVGRMPVLMLSAFLHDVGKGKNSDHTIAGSGIMADVAGRMGFSAVDTKDMVFLVRSHLLMSTLAFRRDVKDRALIERFAQTVRTPDILSMLYLITFADLRAIGPNVWSRWKGSLLSELYLKAMDRLETGMSGPKGREEEAKKRIKAVGRFMAKDIGDEELCAFLSSVPDRYLFSTDPALVASHIMVSHEISETKIATILNPFREEGYHELSVITNDSPGLFAKIAGVITANGANIVDAQIYTNERGLAIDIFRITDAAGKFYDDPEHLRVMREEMADVMAGRVDIKKIVEARFKRRLLSPPGNARPVEIIVDNDVSATETVLEISADDRRGLVYMIATILFEIGCMIERARITTIVDRATDVFYIKEAGGGKIESRERLCEIKERLAEALGE